MGVSVPPRGIIVVTERGYLLLAKSLTDEKAWDVQERLIDCYFRAKGEPQEHRTLALPDYTRKHIWITFDSSGNVVGQVELKNAVVLSEKVDEVFPDSVLMHRQAVIDDLDAIMGYAYELTAKMNQRMNGLITVLGTKPHATQEEANKFWKARVKKSGAQLVGMVGGVA